MSFDETKRTEIQLYLLSRIAADDSEFMKTVTKHFNISATSVKRYLTKCIEDGIVQEDEDQQCGYALRSERYRYQCELTGEPPEEDILYSEWIEPHLNHLPENVQDIWAYTCMEMLNNAIEHSEGSTLSVSIQQNYLYTEIMIRDNGIGIFEKVRRQISENLSREACQEDVLAELYKGKFTTAKEKHSGEGIFFSSKMVDLFAESADGMVYIRDAGTERVIRDRLLAYAMKLNDGGTRVLMRLSNFSTRKSREVFDQYSDAEGGFFKTYIPISDACRTERPIARSQARRLNRRLEEFKEAVLDFANVEFCGQGFADEIFRVFHTAHPEVKLTVSNANEDVTKMIRHVSR